jgi:hypothetical protein
MNIDPLQQALEQLNRANELISCRANIDKLKQELEEARNEVIKERNCCNLLNEILKEVRKEEDFLVKSCEAKDEVIDKLLEAGNFMAECFTEKSQAYIEWKKAKSEIE